MRIRGRASSFYCHYYQGGLMGKKHGGENGKSYRRARKFAEALKRVQRKNRRPFYHVVSNLVAKRKKLREEEKKKKEVMVEEEIKGEEKEQEVEVANGEAAADHGETGEGAGNGGDKNDEGGDGGGENNDGGSALVGAGDEDQMELASWEFLRGGWGEWKQEGDEMWREWVFYQRHWDAENAAFYYWEAMENEAAEEEGHWVENLWVYDDPPNQNRGPNPRDPQV